jgi:hypothetical protein
VEAANKREDEPNACLAGPVEKQDT